jgi:signal transduction histidine kinase
LAKVCIFENVTLKRMNWKIWEVRNWSGLNQKYEHDPEALFLNKRHILFSRITFAGTFMGLFHALEDIPEGQWILSGMDFIMTLLIFSAYLINESGRHRKAKIFLLAFLNLFFFIYAQITPRELGIYLFYFPWVAVAALVFDNRERNYRNAFIVLSVALILLLFLTDFSLLSRWRVSGVETRVPFVINLLTSLVVTAVFIFMMISINDTTEQRLIDQTHQIQKKNLELQKTNEEMDRFVYITSHDLKAPLQSLRGLTQLAHTQDRPTEYLNLIDSQLVKMETFIQELLGYSRNARTSLQPEPVDIRKAVDEVINGLRYAKSAYDITFETFVRVKQPVPLDRMRLMIVLNNLIANSVQYRKPGGANWVKVMVNPTENGIQIMVADNGIGIREDQRPHIFKMFYKGNVESDKSGLGLYIVKETAEKMGGTVQLSSSENEGACFRVELPVQP